MSLTLAAGGATDADLASVVQDLKARMEKLEARNAELEAGLKARQAQLEAALKACPAAEVESRIQALETANAWA